MHKDKLSISIDPNLNEMLEKKIAADKRRGTSKSYYIEEALRKYFDNTTELPKQIEKCINNAIKTFEDRYCRILAKDTKTNYSNQYLLLYMLAYMCSSEEDIKFIMDLRKEAEKQGYLALKNNAIERDIDILFPQEEIFNKGKNSK